MIKKISSLEITRRKYIYECMFPKPSPPANTIRTRIVHGIKSQQQTILCIRSISLTKKQHEKLLLLFIRFDVAFQLWTNLSLEPHAEKVASFFSHFFLSPYLPFSLFIYFVGVAQTPTVHIHHIHMYTWPKKNCSLHWIRKNCGSNLSRKKKTFLVRVRSCLLLWGCTWMCVCVWFVALHDRLYSTLSLHDFIIDIFDTIRYKMLAQAKGKQRSVAKTETKSQKKKN